MDSRFPTHYLTDRRVLRLSPPALRTFVFGTAWSVSNMTDGSIPKADLPLVPFSSEADASELVASGLWVEGGDGYRIAEYDKFQTSALQMEHALANRREADRLRQQKKREADKKAQETEEDTAPQGESRGQSRDGHVTSEGKARRGKEEEKEGPSEFQESEESFNPETAESGSASPTSTADQIEAAWNDAVTLLEVAQSLPAGDPQKQSAHDRYRELTNRGSDSSSAPGPSELFGDPPVNYGPVAYDTAVWNEPPPIPAWARRSP